VVLPNECGLIVADEGEVDQLMAVQAQIDELKQRKTLAPTMTPLQLPSGEAGEVIAQHGGQAQVQQLRVCDICACFLSSKDTAKRLDDHYDGKLHTGYQTIRDKLKELEKALAGRPPVERDRDRERDWRRDRGRTDRGRDFEARDREIDRDRSRYQNKDRFRGGRDDRDRGGDRYDRGGYNYDRRGGYDNRYVTSRMSMQI